MNLKTFLKKVGPCPYCGKLPNVQEVNYIGHDENEKEFSGKYFNAECRNEKCSFSGRRKKNLRVIKIKLFTDDRWGFFVKEAGEDEMDFAIKSWKAGGDKFNDATWKSLKRCKRHNNWNEFKYWLRDKTGITLKGVIK